MTIFWTLFKSERHHLKPIFTGSSWDQVWGQALREVKDHPHSTYLIRSSRTSDGSEHVRDGHAYGRLLREYSKLFLSRMLRTFEERAERI